jgi:excisionase family DNA binding protein
MMTVADVCEYFAVTSGLVVAWIEDGSLPAINIASPGAARAAYRIKRESVAQFEAKCAV